MTTRAKEVAPPQPWALFGTPSIEDGWPVARAMVWPPLTCACGRAVSMVVNRAGKTRCVDCDAKAKKAGQL